jgi:hypothetical protein
MCDKSQREYQRLFDVLANVPDLYGWNPEWITTGLSMFLIRFVRFNVNDCLIQNN